MVDSEPLSNHRSNPRAGRSPENYANAAHVLWSGMHISVDSSPTARDGDPRGTHVDGPALGAHGSVVEGGERVRDFDIRGLQLRRLRQPERDRGPHERGELEQPTEQL